MRKVEKLFIDPETEQLRMVRIEEMDDGRASVSVDGTFRRTVLTMNLSTLTWLTTALNEYLEVKS